MSIWESLKRVMTPAPAPALHEAEGEVGRVLEKLAGIDDPELGVDIVNMGLIRSISLEGGTAFVVMTLSTPGCPVGPMIQAQVASALRELGYQPEVRLAFDPPWTPEAMSELGQLIVGGRRPG